MINVQGINTDNVKSTVSELLELADAASQKLNEIEVLVHDSQGYFKGDCGTAYIDKFNTISLTFPTVKSNILSYAEELNRLTTSYQAQVDALNLTIKKDTHSVETEI